MRHRLEMGAGLMAAEKWAWMGWGSERESRYGNGTFVSSAVRIMLALH